MFDLGAEEDHSSASEGRRYVLDEVVDHLLAAVCDHARHGKVKALGSMTAASEQPVEQGGSCVNVVRRQAACVAVEAGRMQVFHA